MSDDQPTKWTIEEYMGAHDCRGCPPLQLSDQNQETLEAMGEWRVFGPGRIAAIRALRLELLGLQRKITTSDPDPAN